MSILLVQFLSRALLVLCFALACGGWHKTNAAASFADYQRRVREASEKIADVIDARDTEDDEDAQTIDEKPTLNQVRRLLPPTENVEWAGETYNVDNRWLHKLLDQYEKLDSPQISAKDAARRAEILDEIDERLTALEARLDAAMRSLAPTRDADADRGRLNAILHRKEFDEKMQESALPRLLQKIFEWLRSLFPQIRPLTVNPNSSPFVALLRLIIYGLIFALIAFILWRFVLPLLKKRKRERNAEQEGARIVLGERLEVNQSGASLLREADALAREGNLRGAIRKSYIALLCELGDRKILRLAGYKTNRDYLGDVRRRPALYDEMRLLTESFERHWYGLTEANADDWANFRAHCQEVVGGQWSAVS